MMASYMVREDGKNGTVDVLEDRLIRTKKKHIGKDDIQTIPLRAITNVTHDRKMVGSDRVVVQVGTQRLEWKVKNATDMVDELNSKIYL